jgi:Kae1-associated kinase Bud32
MDLIAQGAEAKIYKTDGEVVKERIKKDYRIAEIDEKLRKERTKSEASLISKASRLGVNVPRIIEEDYKEMKLVIEFIDGEKVRDVFDKVSEEEIRTISEQIGAQTAKLHYGNVTHGDLTTSNLILEGKEVYFIDFGLGSYTEKLDDKAVDLHVFKECLTSKHHSVSKICWLAFRKGYLSYQTGASEKVLEQLEKVEARGRYKKTIS